MDRELVSVIIPAYNVDKFLGECVRSLLCQTYTNYEIIIIDDGSTDNTYVIGESLTFESTKVKVFRQENQGVSVARNVGMQKAKGEFYVFVDADDIVAPRYIETLVFCAQKSDMGIIGFTSERKELATEVNLNNVYVNGVIENILCGSNYDGYLWNKIFQKRIIENNNLKFLKNIVVWEDLLFVLQYLKNCSTIAVSNEKLYYYRNREGSAVNKKTSFLYFETMFSYLNQILIRENKTNELAEILPNVDIVELLKLKNIKLFLKFLYLKIKGKLYKI